MNEIWKKISQPANTGRVWYERGYLTTGTPLAKLGFSSSSQLSHLSSTFIGDFKFPPWKGREGDWIGGDLHQDQRLWDLDFQSYLHSLSQGTLIPDLIRSKRLGHDFGIPSVEMLHYLSRSNAQSLDWIGWRLGQGPRLGLLSAHTGRVRYAYWTCLVWDSRADFALLFQSSQWLILRTKFNCLLCFVNLLT